MSITKSYNKQNNTYYAYDTQYVYDETKQRKVQKRRCIGKFDPETNEVIPTGKRGRSPKTWTDTSHVKDTPDENISDGLLQGMSKLSSRLETIESMVSSLTSELNTARTEYDEVMKRFLKKR